MTEPRTYNQVEVVNVHVGRHFVGSLYRDAGEENWYIYGYRTEPDALGRTGDLRDILGEHPSYLETAKRLLAYKGYIASTFEIYVERDGLIHDALYLALELEAQNEN